MEWQILINVGLFLLIIHAHIRIRIISVAFQFLCQEAMSEIQALIKSLNELQEKEESVDHSMNNSNNE